MPVRSFPIPAADCDALERLAVGSLPLFSSAAGELLAEKVTWDGGDLIPSSVSTQNTAEVALGLVSWQKRKASAPLDPIQTLDALWQDARTCAASLTAPFILWAEATLCSPRAHRAFNLVKASLVRDHPSSMQLAWVLEAICAYLPVASDGRETARLADGLYDHIVANQSRRSGLFHGSSRREGWLRRRTPTATLSSQVFPIRALASYAIARDRSDAVERASHALDALAAQQGSDGQWWHRYDVASGRVVERYPIYSVSQNCAMPHAIAIVERASGRRTHADAAGRGFAWVTDTNEVHQSLIEPARAVVWKGVRETRGGFEIIREMNSYYPGRCLLFLADVHTDCPSNRRHA